MALDRRVHVLERSRVSKRRLPLELDVITASVGAASGSDARRRLPQASALEVLREFGRETSIHGVRYFGKAGLSAGGRLCWIAAVLTCTVLTCTCVSSALCQFWRNPMIVMVETTNYPLHNFPFPTITICPPNKIKRKVAENLLLRFLNISDPGDDLLVQLGHFLSALAKFQHPFYFRATEHLQQAADILPAFSRLRISQFMLQVLPTCEEIFQDCFWQGRQLNCCTSFNIQRSEMGFCYSFNSLTSDVTQNCQVSDSKDRSLDTSGGVDTSRQECIPYVNTAAGTTTGLEIFLRKSNVKDRLKYGQRDNSGYRVHVNSPDRFPKAGNSLLVAEGSGRVFTMKVSPSVTMSSPAVRALSPRDRRCYFCNEHHLDIHPAYKQSSCLIECRLRYIATICNCTPYFYRHGIKSVPECDSTQLKCVADHNMDLRLHSLLPADTSAGRLRHNGSPLNCSGCLPSCDHIHYQLETSYEPDVNIYTASSGAYIDIYYAYLGAVKYNQQLAFDAMQLLVSCGGIAGLFLGVSLLTVAEFLYYVMCVAKAIFSSVMPQQPSSGTQPQTTRVTPIK